MPEIFNWYILVILSKVFKTQDHAILYFQHFKHMASLGQPITESNN